MSVNDKFGEMQKLKFVGNREEKNHLGKLGADGMIILK
jgi:hypothetical protein